MKCMDAAVLPSLQLAITVCAASLLLSGCGAVAQASLKSVGIVMRGKPDIAVDVETIAASHFAQIKVTGTEGGAILVLGNIDGQRQAWYSSDKNIVFLQQGLVVASHGGPVELRGMSIMGDNPFNDLRDVTSGTTVQRRYDVMPGYRYGMIVTGTLQPLGHETLSILGKARTLLRIQESLQGDDWNATNQYWVDPSTGFIWKSVQAIAPEASLEIIQLKPYAGNLGRR